MYLYTHTYVYVNMYVWNTYFHICLRTYKHAYTTSEKLLQHPLNTRSLFTYIGLFQVSFRIYGSLFTYTHAHTSSEKLLPHPLNTRFLFTCIGLFQVSFSHIWVSLHIYTRIHLLREVTPTPTQYKVSFHRYRPFSGLFLIFRSLFTCIHAHTTSEKLLTPSQHKSIHD